MTRTCDRCGTAFEAKQVRARFCSGACRAAAGTARKKGRPESIAPVALPTVPRPVGDIADAVCAELAAAGREATSLGRQAVALAERIESGQDTGSAVAALHRELRTTMSEAMAGAAVAADGIDELRSRRERRRA